MPRHQLQTDGGVYTFTKYSGTAGGDAAITSGAGRVTVAAHWQGSILALSGQPVIFYDSAVAVSGGPIFASGHKVVGVIGAGHLPNGAASGDMLVAGAVVRLGFPFYSGLCHTGRSGQLGWTVSYTLDRESP